MNDRFKFRVFLKYNQIMCDIDSYCFLQGLNKCVFHFTNGGQKTLKNDDFILIQCTGLKDKNGKLIYEGDICEYEFEDIGKQKAIIYFNNKYASFLKKPLNNFQYAEINDCKVIGNIYENKELLDV